MTDGERIVPLGELQSFIIRCMRKVGVPEDHARDLADVLVAADYRGHYTHGLNRLHAYIAHVKSGYITTSGKPVVVKETVATALVDGKGLLGPVVGKFCMDLAIDKAWATGIGWVTVKESNHFGIAGWYGIQAVKQGMVGLVFTNGAPDLVPTRAKQAMLGTNPLCCAAPGRGEDNFVLDMATTVSAFGKVEIAQRKGEKIPDGLGMDTDGRQTTDPSKVATLYPLGGTEVTAGYKGYGLAMMVEMFCGILSGSVFGPGVKRIGKRDGNGGTSHSFVAINPDVFANGFPERMSALMDSCRTLEPAEGETEVLVPGDPSRNNMKKCDDRGGILYHPNQIKYANEIATSLDVEPLKTL